MVLVYSPVLAENTSPTVSIGFDQNILIEAIRRVKNGDSLSLIEEASLHKAEDFLKSILDFCSGSVLTSDTGFSGVEAFSLFISAVGFMGDLGDVHKEVQSLSNKLRVLISGISTDVDIDMLINIFEQIGEQRTKDVFESSTKIYMWRP